MEFFLHASCRALLLTDKIMDTYEKKYNEALERAKQLHSEDCSAENKDTCEFIFPELRESEDERIRKFIKDELMCLRVGEKDSDRDKELLNAIAWLEKQKEQKPCDNCNEHEIGYRRGLKVGYQQALDEQKPAEWSEEDEKMLLSIINAFRNGTVSTIGQEQWLKSLPKRFNLQPIQEWSEEDEKIRIGLIATLRGFGANTSTNSTSRNYTFPREIEWLKSLRPQNHWKPSEVCYGAKGDPDPAGVLKPTKEQMEALQRAIDACECEWAYEDTELRSLLADLKKLTHE